MWAERERDVIHERKSSMRQSGSLSYSTKKKGTISKKPMKKSVSQVLPKPSKIKAASGHMVDEFLNEVEPCDPIAVSIAIHSEAEC